MHILIGLFLALTVGGYWLSGHIFGRIAVWPIFTIGIIVWADTPFWTWAEQYVGQGIHRGLGTVYLVGCAVLAWIIASVPSYLVWLSARQLVVQQNRTRDDTLDAAWASEWIRTHK